MTLVSAPVVPASLPTSDLRPVRVEGSPGIVTVALMVT